MHLQITEILKKPEEDRTIEDRKLLELSPDVAKDILKRSKSRELARERKLEVDELFSRVEPVTALKDSLVLNDRFSTLFKATLRRKFNCINF